MGSDAQMSCLLSPCRKRDTRTGWNVNYFLRKYAHIASLQRELGLVLNCGSASTLFKRAKRRRGGVWKCTGDRHRDPDEADHPQALRRLL